jgi:dTDP-4-dehydrorhamnose 3,5-epimerase
MPVIFAAASASWPMLDVCELALPGVKEIRPKRHGDDRGWFTEVWNLDSWQAAGVDFEFVQDNHSYSAAKGVLRGLHYQRAPAAQDKLVRATRGSIWDVAVDIRQGSPTFGRWVGLILSADLGNQVLVPKGFAHGFVTLEEHSEVQYKVTAPYRADLDRAIRFDDPAIGVEWPLSDVQLSAKDKVAPLLAAADASGIDWRG